MKGQLQAAAKALAYVRGQPVESDYIKDELAEIVANNEYELQVVPQTSYIGSWMACFHGSLHKGNSNLRRIILGAGLQMMQQFTGNGIMMPPPSSCRARCHMDGLLTFIPKASTSSFTSALLSSGNLEPFPIPSLFPLLRHLSMSCQLRSRSGLSNTLAVGSSSSGALLG